jgi:xanthine/CO dehydrogenase XdhC/CoxF family maturation factor
MHLGIETLSSFFRRHQGERALVLATVVSTTGSTYRKPGALMLMASDGSYAGMISGGCLEDDLLRRAAPVFEDGVPESVLYDLDDDPELVWGLGLGCGGSVRLLLCRLEHGSGLAVLAALFDALERRDPCLLGLVTDGSAGAGPELGALALVSAGGKRAGDATVLSALQTRELDAAPRAASFGFGDAPSQARGLAIRVTPPPRVLLCGAGPDAAPLADSVRRLGWECLVVDHRPAHAREELFAAGTRVRCQRPEDLTAEQLGAVSAAVVMSHHVEHDLAYLRRLAERSPVYVGLLGPVRRREELLQRLGDAADGLGAVHGPAGLDIGAELPESIALSIVAEIHAVLNGRSAAPLAHDEAPSPRRMEYANE